MWRSERAFGPPSGPAGPLSLPPRSGVEPNPNPAVGSVGPNVSVAGDPSAVSGAEAGFGSTHVMYPATGGSPVPQAWNGWPVEWDVPWTTTNVPAAGLDVVFACLDLNSRIVADMPIFRQGRNRATLDALPWQGNPDPEFYTHWGEFMRQAWWSFQGVGEVFILATSRYSQGEENGYPRTFVVAAPGAVFPQTVNGQRVYTLPNGSKIPAADVLHLRYLSWPGKNFGDGPLSVAQDRIRAARALMRYGGDLASNGGIPWAVLKHKYKLGATQAADMRGQWVSAAHDRSGAPAVLDMDTNLEVLQVSPKDMALTELQNYAESRIAVLLGVPPFMLALNGSDSMTYNNGVAVYENHWRTTLKPIGNYIIGGLSGWVLPSTQQLKLVPDAYIESDPTARA